MTTEAEYFQQYRTQFDAFLRGTTDVRPRLPHHTSTYEIQAYNRAELWAAQQAVIRSGDAYVYRENTTYLEAERAGRYNQNGYADMAEFFGVVDDNGNVVGGRRLDTNRDGDLERHHQSLFSSDVGDRFTVGAGESGRYLDAVSFASATTRALDAIRAGRVPSEVETNMDIQGVSETLARQHGTPLPVPLGVGQEPGMVQVGDALEPMDLTGKGHVYGDITQTIALYQGNVRVTYPVQLSPDPESAAPPTSGTPGAAPSRRTTP